MPSPVVLLTLPLPEPGMRMLAEAGEPGLEVRVLGRIPTTGELRDQLRRGVDVLCPQLTDPVDAATLDAGLPRLRAVSNYAVGVNNIDVDAATARRIAVGNTPGVLTDATADCAMGLLLAAARRLCEGDRLVRAGGWSGWDPQWMLGLELRGALLGVVGLGRIGQAVARRALGFGMRVAHAAHGTARPVDGDLQGRVVAMPLERLLEEADAVSLHVPLTPSTRHLIDEGALRRMRSSAVLVNTARGAVVDEAALVRALREGWIAAAGLDVYEDEPRLAPGLAELPNAVLAPHLGSATVRTRSAMAEICAGNALAALRGLPLPHSVNLPAWAGGPPPALLAS